MVQDYQDYRDKKEVRDYQDEIRIWEKVIETQKHFNDLCLKVRSVAISILGVLLGAAGISFRLASSSQAPIIFIGIAIIVWIAFYVMDRYWHHELLRGAVKHGKKIEKKLRKEIPSIALTYTIQKQSHASLDCTAGRKLTIFYLSILTILISILVVMVHI